MRPILAVVAATSIGCGSDLNLSSTEQDSVVLSPTSHDFGNLMVNTSSAPYSVTVAPASNANDDQVTSVTGCPGFNITANNLPAHVYRTCRSGHGGCQTDHYQDYTFTVTFAPTVQGTTSCAVTVHLQSGSTRTTTMSGKGLPPPVQIDVQPPSIAFGDVRVNTDSSAAPLTVHNTGSQTMTVSSTIITTGFTIATGPTSQFTVNSGATQAFTIVCHPTATGGLTGSLTVNSNDTMHPQVAIPLTCSGIDSNLEVSPSPATIATTRVGEPGDVTINLQNTGAATMTIDSVAVTGTGLTMTSGPSAGTTLALNQTAMVTVHFDAAAAGEGDGMLTTAYDGTHTRSTPIAARALGTSMSVSPDGDFDFGPVCAGQTKEQPFLIMANDLGAFQVIQLDDPTAPFVLTKPSLPTDVEGSGANQVQFSVAVTPAASGPLSTTLMIGTDIPGGAPHPLNVAVEGLTGGINATPESLDLGSHALDTTTIGMPVTVSNCAPTPITVSNARIEGQNASEFAIVSQPDSPTIETTGNASWLVVLEARSVGLKEATFAVDYAGGTATVPLLGEGLGDGTSGGDSYYTCSAGGGGLASWPLALALVALARRRRC